MRERLYFSNVVIGGEVNPKSLLKQSVNSFVQANFYRQRTRVLNQLHQYFVILDLDN